MMFRTISVTLDSIIDAAGARCGYACDREARFLVQLTADGETDSAYSCHLHEGEVELSLLRSLCATLARRLDGDDTPEPTRDELEEIVRGNRDTIGELAGALEQGERELADLRRLHFALFARVAEIAQHTRGDGRYGA